MVFKFAVVETILKATVAKNGYGHGCNLWHQELSETFLCYSNNYAEGTMFYVLFYRNTSTTT